MNQSELIADKLIAAMRATLVPLTVSTSVVAVPVLPANRVDPVIPPVNVDVEPRPVVPVKLGESYLIQHYKLPLLLAAIKAGVEAVALIGPAGSGKTSVCAVIADMLGRPFEAVSFGNMTSKSDILGFVDANGVYQDTAPVRCGTNGGIFLCDEFDAGNANVGLYLNMIAANSFFATPTGMRRKHANFTLVLGMNTYGRGKSRAYVGRNELDAATRNRFVTIDWDYDPAVEAAMVGCKLPQPRLDIGKGGICTPMEWLARVMDIRAKIERCGINHVVSPRTTKNGVKLFEQGVGRYWVEEMTLWQGLDSDSRAKIEGTDLSDED